MPFLHNVTRGRGVPPSGWPRWPSTTSTSAGCRRSTSSAGNCSPRCGPSSPPRGGPAAVLGQPQLAPDARRHGGRMRDDGVRRALAFVTSAVRLVLVVPAVPGGHRGGPGRGRARRAGDATRSATTTTIRASCGRSPTRYARALASWSVRRDAAPAGVHRPLDPVHDGAQSAGPQRRAVPAQLRETAPAGGRRRPRRTWSGTWSGRAGPVRRTCPGSSRTSTTTWGRWPRTGSPAVVVSPIGFISDHLEVVWDLDTEAADRRSRLGLASPGRPPRAWTRGSCDGPGSRAWSGWIRQAPRRPARHAPGLGHLPQQLLPDQESSRLSEPSRRSRASRGRSGEGGVAGGYQCPPAGGGERSQRVVPLPGLEGVDRPARCGPFGQGEHPVEQAGPGVEPPGARVEHRWQVVRVIVAAQRGQGAGQLRAPPRDIQVGELGRGLGERLGQLRLGLGRRGPGGGQARAGRLRQGKACQTTVSNVSPEPETCFRTSGTRPISPASTPSPATSAAPVNGVPGPGSPRGSPAAGNTSRISSGCSGESRESASRRGTSGRRWPRRTSGPRRRRSRPARRRRG